MRVGARDRVGAAGVVDGAANRRDGAARVASVPAAFDRRVLHHRDAKCASAQCAVFDLVGQAPGSGEVAAGVGAVTDVVGKQSGLDMGSDASLSSRCRPVSAIGRVNSSSSTSACWAVGSTSTSERWV
jgi:hypothetical protein